MIEYRKITRGYCNNIFDSFEQLKQYKIEFISNGMVV